MENKINLDELLKSPLARDELTKFIMAEDGMTQDKTLKLLEDERKELSHYLECILEADEALYFQLTWTNENNSDEFAIFSWAAGFYLKRNGCCGDDLSGPYASAEEIVNENDGLLSYAFAEDDTEHEDYLEGGGVDIHMNGTLCDSDPIKADEFYAKITHRK